MEDAEDEGSQQDEEAIDSDNLTEQLEELEEGMSEEDNPHGFVFAHQLDTFRKNKRERIEQ